MPLLTPWGYNRLGVPMKRFIPLLIITVLFLLPLSADGNFEIHEKKVQRPERKPESIIVKFKQETSFSQIDAFRKHYDSRAAKTRKYSDFITVNLPAGADVINFSKIVEGNPLVEFAEPNYIAYAQMIPNDPYYKYQWNFKSVNAESAWEVSSGEDVVVAVVDTGIAYENYRQLWVRYEIAPDLNGTCFVDGYDFVNNDSHPNDDQGHGTHVAGTIAQTTNNNLGVAGLSFSSCLMPVKVLDARGSGTYADIAEGIIYAADKGASVINLSLGGAHDSQILKNAVAYAYGKGVIVVAAAGNNGKSELLYPAAYNDYVISVGAVRFDETISPYSNYGTSLDLVAPGGDLSVDQNNDGYGDGILQQTFNRHPRDWGYWFYEGTSMAAPHVSAVAAMVISKGAETDKVREILAESAKDLGDPGRDNIYGYGLVDAYEALRMVGIEFPQPPDPTPTQTPTPTPSPTSTPYPSPTQTPTPTPTATPTPNPQIPWWCKYFSSHPYCQ